VVVRPHPVCRDEYELLVGEVQWRAASEAELPSVYARLCGGPELNAALAELDALAADRYRNAMTVATTLKTLCKGIPHPTRKGRSISHQNLAELSGLSRGLVTQHISLLALPAPVRQLLAQGRLSLGHGKILCAMDLAGSPERKIGLAYQAVRGDWSVRRLEQELRGTPARQGSPTPAALTADHSGERVTDPNIARLAERLSEKLGCPAEIEHRTSGAGVVHLRYFSLEILDGLLESMGLKEE
jgi:ParB family chromosome partitioning protein